MTEFEPTPKFSPDGRINVISPLDGRLVGRVAATPVTAIAERAAAARAAQAEWAARPLGERAQALKRLKPIFAAAGDELVELLREEIGRHPAESWFAEIVGNLDLIQWWTGPGLKHLKSVNVSLSPISYPFKKARVDAVPRGVLGLITPWNYPVAIPLRALVPALLAGNAVLWKPSEYAALVSERLGALVAEVVPRDLVQVLQGGGDVGAALIEHVDGVGFTGSLATGRKVAAAAAARLIPASLELGGKDFAVVLPDADLDRAAAGIAWGANTNAGQNCAAIEIVAVHADVAAVFSEKLKAEVRKMAPFVGPLVNAAQKAKVAAQLEQAVAAGGLIGEGGEGAAGGLRIEPTVIERVPWEADLLRCETFGPVLPLVVYRDLDEVAAWLEASDYGLTLSLWSRNVEAAAAWGAGRPVGVVTINNHGFTAAIAAMPWTGVKGSGLGVTNSPHALEWMVRPQGILIDRSRLREPWWHPYNDAAIKLGRAMARLNGGVGSKWAALKDLFAGFMRRWK